MLGSLLLAVASAVAEMPVAPATQPDPALLAFLGEWSEDDASLIDAVIPAADAPAPELPVAPPVVPSEEWEARLRRGAERWAQMDAAQRERAQARLQRWQALGADQRQSLLERRDQLHQLPAEERERLRTRYRERPPSHEAREDRARLLTPEEGARLRECLQRQARGRARDCRALLPEAIRDPGPPL